MCVDTIKRVKQLTKEIRIAQSLVSTRKQTMRKDFRSSSAETRFANSSLKVKSRSLADVQEDMKNDF